MKAVGDRWKAPYAGIWAFWIAFRSIARGLSLFLSDRPKTPLRVLCIMSFDTLHMLRNARPLPALKLRLLAALLDFAACANAALDHKRCCPRERRETRQLLEEAGLGSLVAEYLQRLNDLETRRPLPGGDDVQFHSVRSYREAVVRLSLGMVAATVNGSQGVNDAILATYGNAALVILFRIVMLCQIIDDVLDYSQDMSAGLPSFLTASKSLSRAFELVRLATLGYADARDLPRTGDLYPLRLALFLVSTSAKLVIVLGRWRQRYSSTAIPSRDECLTSAVAGTRYRPAQVAGESLPGTRRFDPLTDADDRARAFAAAAASATTRSNSER